MQGKTLYTILLAIIAVLTLALTVMVIFLVTTFNGRTPAVEDITKRPVVKETIPPEEQAEFNLYATGDNANSKTDALFNLKSTEDHPNSFLMASISIIYDAGEKNKLLESRKAFFETYLSQLKEATIEYFRKKNLEDVRAEDAMQKCRDDLKEIYGQIISESSKEQIILRIVFDKWIPQ